VAAWLIAARRVNTLVLVHRQQLLDQWHVNAGEKVIHFSRAKPAPVIQ
jgi:superfamily II DNA or RNA helicase